MCGILGAVTSGIVTYEEIVSGLKASVYRGPDSSMTKKFGISCERELILGFNRLAIQDLSSAADQPFYKDHLVITFNGEIYNKDKIIKEEKFDNLITNSDTEVILELFRKYNSSFVSHLNGMFSICIFDELRSELFLARDRYGIKPLFYTMKDNEFYFSSDIKELYRILIRHFNTVYINKDFFYRNLLLDPFVGFGATPFQNIISFPKGKIMKLNLNTMSQHWIQYYDFRQIIINPGIQKIDVKTVFLEAVKSQLISDVPVSCALSGGFDSSTISLLASELLEKEQQLTLFSIDLKDKSGEFDKDYGYALNLYNSLRRENKKMVSVSLDKSWTLDIIDKIVLSLGSPIYDERAIVWFNMYQNVHQNGIKVLLNGQGADEMWYGYYPEIWGWFSCLYHRDFKYYSLYEYFIKRNQNSVFSKAMTFDCSKYIEKYSLELYEDISSISIDDNNQKKISVFMIDKVLESLLKYEDSISMLNSVEVRVPFLDNEMSEYALELEPYMHILGRTGSKVLGKDYLKRAFSRYEQLIPIIQRRKSPLPKPKSHDSDLIELFNTHLCEINESELVNSMFDINEIIKAIDYLNEGFYGGINDFLIQVISLWRFEQLFDLNVI